MNRRTISIPVFRASPASAVRVRGFTLIEMVVTIVILGVLAALSAPLLTSGLRAFDATTTGVRTLGNLRYATERMAREIREMRYSAGAYVLTTPSFPNSNTLTFTKTDATVVTIALTGTPPPPVNLTLQYSTLTTTPVNPVLTDQVTALDFHYFQRNGVTNATSAANVGLVQVTLTLQNPVTGAYQQRTRVALRNRE